MKPILNNHSNASEREEALDFEKELKFLSAGGKKLFGHRFEILPDNHEIVYQLLLYFLSYEKQAQQAGIDINKGILLIGPIGCGKTWMMKLLSYLNPNKIFFLKTTRDIAFEFTKCGFEVIEKYGRSFLNDGRPKAYCLDDLGAETSLKHYGNECNVMEEILQTRYEQFIANGCITHATTNFNADALEEIYGPRVRSRMREMFNLVAFDATAKDRRT